jgi:hypothetical protein
MADDTVDPPRLTAEQYRERAKLVRQTAAATTSRLRRQGLLDTARLYRRTRRHCRQQRTGEIIWIAFARSADAICRPGSGGVARYSDPICSTKKRAPAYQAQEAVHAQTELSLRASRARPRKDSEEGREAATAAGTRGRTPPTRLHNPIRRIEPLSRRAQFGPCALITDCLCRPSALFLEAERRLLALSPRHPLPIRFVAPNQRGKPLTVACRARPAALR